MSTSLHFCPPADLPGNVTEPLSSETALTLDTSWTSNTGEGLTFQNPQQPKLILDRMA